MVDTVPPELRAGHLGDNSVVVFVNIVAVDPALAAFDDEDPLTLAPLDLVLEDIRIDTVFTPECYVRLYVLVNFIRLDVRVAFFDAEDPLRQVPYDGVFVDRTVCLVFEVDPCQFVISDKLVRFDHDAVVVAFHEYAVFVVGLDLIVLNFPVAPDFIIIGVDVDTIQRTFLDSIIEDEGVRGLDDDALALGPKDEVVYDPREVREADFDTTTMIFLDFGPR